MQTLVITSANQLALLINNNPALLNIPAFKVLHTTAQQLTNNKSTRCKACNKAQPNVYAQLRPQMETALNTLTTADFVLMKSILGINQLCYYKKNLKTSKLEQTCL